MVAVLVVVVGALYLGRDILIPLALAILLSFMLAPIVTRLRRWGLGRIPSVLAVVVLLFVALLGLGSIVASQVVHLAENLPRYEWNLRAKIRDLPIAVPSGGVVERTTDMLRDLRKELEKATEEPEAQGATWPRSKPRSRCWCRCSNRLRPCRRCARSAGRWSSRSHRRPGVGVRDLHVAAARGSARSHHPAGWLRRRRAHHRSHERRGQADQPLSADAAGDQYLLYGTPVGIGLYFVGVPNPILWGLLATILRFVPRRAGDRGAVPDRSVVRGRPGWTLPLLTIALFVTLELIINNVLEPWLYGSSTGCRRSRCWSPPWSGPRSGGRSGCCSRRPTVCLVVLGRHVPQLAFFDVLLGDEPALAPELKFYQRLLARDPDEATELAEEYLEDEPLEKLYDSVIIPALGLAEQDRLRGSLDRASVQGMAEDTIGIVEYLMEEEERDPERAGRRCRATACRPRLPRCCASARAMASTRPRPRCWRTCSCSAA